MRYDYLERLATPGVLAAQAANGVASLRATVGADRTSDRFTENEAAFIAARDSFYLASVSETGWPYVQHRGGPPGFVKVLDATTLGFADYRGNRQYISLGNIAADDRVAFRLRSAAPVSIVRFMRRCRAGCLRGARHPARHRYGLHHWPGHAGCA